MPDPLITVVIPTYRRPHLLKRAVRSVREQTYPHWNIWIYDNASGDETEEVVRQMMRDDPRIHYYQHPKNIGSTPNFEFGIRRVQTPFFSCLSDDDLVLPQFLETAIQTFQRYPDVGMVGLSHLGIDEKGDIQLVGLEGRKEIEVYDRTTAPAEIFKADFPPWTSILYSTKVAARVHPYYSDNFYHDVLFNYRIAHMSGLVLVNSPGALYLYYPDNFSRTYRIKQRLLDLMSTIEHVQALPTGKPEIDQTTLSVFSSALETVTFNGSIRACSSRSWDDLDFGLSLYESRGKSLRKRILLRTVATLARYLPFFPPLLRLALWSRLKSINLYNRKTKRKQYQNLIDWFLTFS